MARPAVQAAQAPEKDIESFTWAFRYIAYSDKSCIVGIPSWSLFLSRETLQEALPGLQDDNNNDNDNDDDDDNNAKNNNSHTTTAATTTNTTTDNNDNDNEDK